MAYFGDNVVSNEFFLRKKIQNVDVSFGYPNSTVKTSFSPYTGDYERVLGQTVNSYKLYASLEMFESGYSGYEVPLGSIKLTNPNLGNFARIKNFYGSFNEVPQFIFNTSNSYSIGSEVEMDGGGITTIDGAYVLLVQVEFDTYIVAASFGSFSDDIIANVGLEIIIEVNEGSLTYTPEFPFFGP